MNIFRLYMCMTILIMGYKSYVSHCLFVYLSYLYIISVVIKGGGKD